MIESMEVIVMALFVLGGIGLVVTFIKYPKDAAITVFKVITFPFWRFWELLKIIFHLLVFPLVLLEGLIGVNMVSQLINADLKSDTYKTESRKKINFKTFRRYFFIQSLDQERLQNSVNEAKASCPELNLQNVIFKSSSQFIVVEFPKLKFYGFNFLIQWLAEEFKGQQVFGYSTNGMTSFFAWNDNKSENELIGLTNRQKAFWVSLYDDLDKKQFLRFDQSIQINTELRTDSFETILKNAK